jgi:hypothetical protein
MAEAFLFFTKWRWRFLSQKIQIKRGIRENLTFSLSVGEMAFCTDTKELFIGTSSGNHLIGGINGGGSIISDSTNNGYLVIDGNEIQVYDDSILSLSNLTDIDLTGNANGYVLTYNSTTNKFEPKPLPSGNGSGATNLDGLSDVDLTTTLPSDGAILTFSNGIWKPSLSAVTGITTEDFNKEFVYLTKPLEVRKLTISDTTKTSISLSWLPSRTNNVKQYNIYLNNVPHSTTTSTNYQITGLTNSTTYSIKITVIDANNIESNGIIISARTLGNYALSLQKNQYVEVPNLTFNSVEFTLQFDALENSWNNTIIESKSSQKSYTFSSQSDGIRWKRTLFPTMYVDGTYITDDWYYSLAQNQKMAIRLDTPLDDTASDNFNLFANRNNISDMIGVLYRVKFYKFNDDGTRKLICDYDFSYQSNGTVSDFLKNGSDLILHGGTFIAN